MIDIPSSGEVRRVSRSNYDARRSGIREIYYKIIGQETVQFTAKSTALLMLPRFGLERKTRRHEEEIKARNQLIVQYKLDREDSRISAGAGEPVRFERSTCLWTVPPIRCAERVGDSPKKRREMVGEHRGDHGRQTGDQSAGRCRVQRRATGNPCRTWRDIYTKLFASIDAAGQRYLKACAEAMERPVTGFDPAVVQLLEFPFEVEAGGALNTDHLRELTLVAAGRAGNGSRPASLFQNQRTAAHQSRAPRRGDDCRRFPDVRTIRPSSSAAKRRIAARSFRAISWKILSPGIPQPFTKAADGWNSRNASPPNNPLTARVLVNRVWMHHFGEGFVPHAR